MAILIILLLLGVVLGGLCLFAGRWAITIGSSEVGTNTFNEQSHCRLASWAGTALLRKHGISISLQTLSPRQLSGVHLTASKVGTICFPKLLVAAKTVPNPVRLLQGALTELTCRQLQLGANERARSGDGNGRAAWLPITISGLELAIGKPAPDGSKSKKKKKKKTDVLQQAKASWVVSSAFRAACWFLPHVPITVKDISVKLQVQLGRSEQCCLPASN
jgi:hypothetical protein